MPGAWLFHQALRNGGSVPSSCVTWYWSRGSACLRARSSASVSFSSIGFLAVGPVAGAAGRCGLASQALDESTNESTETSAAQDLGIDMSGSPFDHEVRAS